MDTVSVHCGIHCSCVFMSCVGITERAAQIVLNCYVMILFCLSLHHSHFCTCVGLLSCMHSMRVNFLVLLMSSRCHHRTATNKPCLAYRKAYSCGRRYKAYSCVVSQALIDMLSGIMLEALANISALHTPWHTTTVAEV